MGIDEVGRGPLAGPVAVGVVLVPAAFAWEQIAGVADSKRLSASARETITQRANYLRRRGGLYFTVATVSAAVIDEIGITDAIRRAIGRGVSRCAMYHNRCMGTAIDWGQVSVKLDGGLTAPSYCCDQQTIIKGDSIEPTIGLASIVAKVHRDRYMHRLSETPVFQPYGFASHKGYGTVRHRQAIERYGVSSEHRRTYCGNINSVV